MQLLKQGTQSAGTSQLPSAQQGRLLIFFQLHLHQLNSIRTAGAVFAGTPRPILGAIAHMYACCEHLGGVVGLTGRMHSYWRSSRPASVRPSGFQISVKIRSAASSNWPHVRK